MIDSQAVQQFLQAVARMDGHAAATLLPQVWHETRGPGALSFRTGVVGMAVRRLYAGGHVTEFVDARLHELRTRAASTHVLDETEQADLCILLAASGAGLEARDIAATLASPWASVFTNTDEHGAPRAWDPVGSLRAGADLPAAYRDCLRRFSSPVETALNAMVLTWIDSARRGPLSVLPAVFRPDALQASRQGAAATSRGEDQLRALAQAVRADERLTHEQALACWFWLTALVGDTEACKAEVARLRSQPESATLLDPAPAWLAPLETRGFTVAGAGSG